MASSSDLDFFIGEMRGTVNRMLGVIDGTVTGTSDLLRYVNNYIGYSIYEATGGLLCEQHAKELVAANKVLFDIIRDPSILPKGYQSAVDEISSL